MTKHWVRTTVCMTALQLLSKTYPTAQYKMCGQLPCHFFRQQKCKLIQLPKGSLSLCRTVIASHSNDHVCIPIVITGRTFVWSAYSIVSLCYFSQGTGRKDKILANFTFVKKLAELVIGTQASILCILSGMCGSYSQVLNYLGISHRQAVNMCSTNKMCVYYLFPSFFSLFSFFIFSSHRSSLSPTFQPVKTMSLLLSCSPSTLL